MPLAVIARLKLPNTSYCELASPMLGRIWGWVATTCIASMNASWATFQLHRSTLATWTWTKRSSSGQRAKWSPSSPT